MRYCPDCGTGHDCEGERPAGTSDAVRIAEIERDRDIALAKLSARQDKDWNETRIEVAGIEAEAEVEAAVAEAEVVGAAIEAGVVDSEPEPIVIDAPPPADDAPDDAPPEVEGSAPPEPKRKAAGLGMW